MKQTDPRSVEDGVSRVANALVTWIARHWLLLVNGAWALYVLLPILAPVLMNAGFVGPASLIYGLYSFLCHQLPDHSYFLFGRTLLPQEIHFQTLGYPINNLPHLFRRVTGDEILGYKIAICQRDFAIYGSILVAGLVYGLVRERTDPRRLPLALFLLLTLPMALDGGLQLIGIHTSTWWLRSVTGGIFGFAAVWLAYPPLEQAMCEARFQANAGTDALSPPTNSTT